MRGSNQVSWDYDSAYSEELPLLNFTIIAGVCLLIPVVVCVLFAVGSFFGVQWYITAVSILLVGRFLMGLLEH